ncbi:MULTISPECIES: NAD(P)/FAD-dependent oxidoreductase [Microbacterium]|uniref:NAD(P)/FAD-dependent oxidoreductase n=1 Tax=Microbacterium TaxID=33882 RepID=UPI00217ED687|nr:MULTISPECIES: FAD-binding oxidoreductase [Microbacterium]UWF77631.1 FAD-binding oxidoreductase [Microbacterium neungamense]WCM55801.1 FAD-binding oxidoreductase [Microbacterium sp. EF45047]
MSASRPENIVVIGGGILGVSTAAHLARAGATVTLVTAGSLADGASGRSIAWLNSSGDRSAAYHYLRLLALDRYRTWAARHPESSAYLRFDGAMKWAGPEESFRETFAFERASGYDAVWIDRSQVAALAPDVNPDAVAEEGAIFNPGEGWVNLPDLIAALVAEARGNGATVVENAGEARVDVRDGVVTGVILADGSRLDADRVVLATGPAVPAQLAELGVTVPDASPAAFVLFTEPVDVEVKTVLNTPRVAVRPTPDRRLVLDAGWAEESIVVGEDGSITVPDASVQGLLEEASKVLAGNPVLTASRVGAGWKPIPGDGEPVAGAVPGIDGLYTLFTHSGATLGLILGELMAEEVLTGQPSPVLASFRIERFDENSTPTQVGTDAWAPVASGR